MARALVTKLRIPDTAAQTRKSPVARSGRAEASCHDISNTWLAHGYSSSSLTTPATQSGLCGAFIPFTGFASSAVRFNGAHVGQSGLTDPGERSANKSRVSPVRCASPVAPLSQQRSNVESRGSGRLRCNCIRKVSPTRKEVPLCLTGTVSKICWRFYTDALRRRLTRSHCNVGALSMAICQWDSKSIVWAAGVSSLLWCKVLEERKKFSMSTTTNTVTPRCALCCPRWAVLVRRYSF